MKKKFDCLTDLQVLLLDELKKAVRGRDREEAGFYIEQIMRVEERKPAPVKARRVLARVAINKAAKKAPKRKQPRPTPTPSEPPSATPQNAEPPKKRKPARAAKPKSVEPPRAPSRHETSAPAAGKCCICKRSFMAGDRVVVDEDSGLVSIMHPGCTPKA